MTALAGLVWSGLVWSLGGSWKLRRLALHTRCGAALLCLLGLACSSVAAARVPGGHVAPQCLFAGPSTSICSCSPSCALLPPVLPLPLPPPTLKWSGEVDEVLGYLPTYLAQLEVPAWPKRPSAAATPSRSTFVLVAILLLLLRGTACFPHCACCLFLPLLPPPVASHCTYACRPGWLAGRWLCPHLLEPVSVRTAAYKVLRVCPKGKVPAKVPASVPVPKVREAGWVRTGSNDAKLQLTFLDMEQGRCLPPFLQHHAVGTYRQVPYPPAP